MQKRKTPKTNRNSPAKKKYFPYFVVVVERGNRRFGFLVRFLGISISHGQNVHFAYKCCVCACEWLNKFEIWNSLLSLNEFHSFPFCRKGPEENIVQHTITIEREKESNKNEMLGGVEDNIPYTVHIPDPESYLYSMFNPCTNVSSRLAVAVCCSLCTSHARENYINYPLFHSRSLVHIFLRLVALDYHYGSAIIWLWIYYCCYCYGHCVLVFHPKIVYKWVCCVHFVVWENEEVRGAIRLASVYYTIRICLCAAVRIVFVRDSAECWWHTQQHICSNK